MPPSKFVLEAQARGVVIQAISSLAVNQQQSFDCSIHISLCCLGKRFVVTEHLPQMNGQASGHSGNRLVLAAGVVQDSQKRYMGFRVLCCPYP